MTRSAVVSQFDQTVRREIQPRQRRHAKRRPNPGERTADRPRTLPVSRRSGRFRPNRIDCDVPRPQRRLFRPGGERDIARAPPFRDRGHTSTRGRIARRRKCHLRSAGPRHPCDGKPCWQSPAHRPRIAPDPPCGRRCPSPRHLRRVLRAKLPPR